MQFCRSLVLILLFGAVAACGQPSPATQSAPDAVSGTLTVELVKIIPTGREYAAVAFGTERVAELPCTSTHAIDVVDWSCQSSTYRFTLSHVLPTSFAEGTLFGPLPAALARPVSCVTGGTRGVDVAVEYTCKPK